MGTYEEHLAETYRSLMHYGSTALKFVFAANGAAAIASLTFLGHFVAASDRTPPDLRWPLASFVAGVLIGGCATATSYVTQLTLYNETLQGELAGDATKHIIWLRTSMVLIAAGILLFGVGSLWAVFQLG